MRERKMKKLQKITTIPILTALLISAPANIGRMRDTTAIASADTGSDTPDIVETIRDRHLGS